MTDAPPAPGYAITTEGGVATLTFARPNVGNAISPEMTAGLTAFFVGAQADASVRCIVVTGQGKHFSAGGDLAGFARSLELGKAVLQAQFDERLRAVADLARAVLAFDRPIVAVVRGGVAGAGLLFALSADLVMADDTALFLFSHQRMGLSPDGCVSWLLPRIVGPRTAGRLILTAASVKAPEALALGLVTQIVADTELDQEAAKLTRRFAKAPQGAIRLAKSLLRSSATGDLDTQLDAERAAIVESVGHPDFAEGISAFLEKRTAVFPSSRD